MLEKLCRICPNTASWERPTGNKEESGGFAGANGFGIEEWLTRKEWLLSGYNGLLAYHGSMDEEQRICRTGYADLSFYL